MSTPQVPQLTSLGEQLAQDKDRKHLESLLERLPEETTPAANAAPKNTLPGKANASNRQEAVKSARHILRSVWSMQHIDKLTKKPNSDTRHPAPSSSPPPPPV